MDEREHKGIDHLRNFDNELELVYKLSQEFAQMLRQGEVRRLEPWLIQVEENDMIERIRNLSHLLYCLDRVLLFQNLRENHN